ncbi:LysR family transcriptional regulator [Aureimonas flava]|uniref:LysR family transcriptional regulator n=1 Tax=Aureimonas flava TaxID=2320271 RepID=A0A3A1WRC1_9HYPH|nr:LysR family transcriptional regulator [Aureimonas flava]
MPALSSLKVFEEVGRSGSFTRAAERLNLTQSAVSRQVRRLEDELGEPLLIRRHHRLELTASGARLLRALGRALHEVETAVRAIRERTDPARLRVNVPPTLAKRWLMPRLGAFREAHPEIDLSVTTQLSDSLADSGLLDCAIRFGDGEWPDVQSQRLMTERHIAVCAPALAERAGDPPDLRRFTLIHVLADADRRYLTWARWLDAAGLPDLPDAGGLEFDLLDLSVEAACQGLGAAVVDRGMVARELARGELVQLGSVAAEGHESYWFVTHRGEGDPPKVALFRQWLLGEVERA